MKIAKIRVKNFRSIWQLEVPSKDSFKNLVVIIGPNNSGKSNILRAIRLVLEQLDENTLKNIPIQNPWFFNHYDEPSVIEIFLDFDDSEAQQILEALEGKIEVVKSAYLKVELLKNHVETKWKLSELQIFGHFDESAVELAKEFYTEVAKLGSKDLKEASPSPIKVVQNGEVILHDAFRAIINVIGKDTGKVVYIHTGKELDSSPYNGREDIPIPNYLMENIRWICQSSLRRSFIKQLQMVKDASDYSADGSTIHYEAEDFPVELFGSGSLAFDAILATLLRVENEKGNSIALIEEPELHLHPDLVRELAMIFEEFAERGKLQLFVVTQSPEFIDALSDKSVVIFTKKSRDGPHGDPATIAIQARKDTEEDAEKVFEYLTIELGARPLFANVLLLVEGGDDERLLRYWINCSRRDLPNLRKYSICIVPFAKRFQDGGLLNFVRILKEKLKYDVFVILDGDEKGEKMYDLLRKKFADIPFKWSVPDILSFIDPELIADAIKGVVQSLGIELKGNQEDKYKEYLEKVKNGALKEKDGKKVYENLLQLLKEASDMSILQLKDKIGLEIIKRKPKIPGEVKGVLAQIDQMLGG